MNIVACDANILIDLLQVDLFNAFLKLRWEMHVPPDVVDEVQEENSDLLIQAINSRDILVPTFTRGAFPNPGLQSKVSASFHPRLFLLAFSGKFFCSFADR